MRDSFDWTLISWIKKKRKEKAKAARRIALYQGKMARYYNTNVKLRRFEVGDWVLRKVTQATKEPSQGKLGPNWEGPYKIIQYYRMVTYHLEDRYGKKLPHSWNAEHLKKYYPWGTHISYLFMIKKFVYSNNIFYPWIEDRLHLNNCLNMLAVTQILSIIILTSISKKLDTHEVHS